MFFWGVGWKDEDKLKALGRLQGILTHEAAARDFPCTVAEVDGGATVGMSPSLCLPSSFRCFLLLSPTNLSLLKKEWACLPTPWRLHPAMHHLKVACGFVWIPLPGCQILSCTPLLHHSPTPPSKMLTLGFCLQRDSSAGGHHKVRNICKSRLG